MAAGSLVSESVLAGTGSTPHVVDPEDRSYISSMFRRYLKSSNFDELTKLAGEDPRKFTASIPLNGTMQNEVVWDLLRDPATTGDTLIKLYRACKAQGWDTPFMLVAAVSASVAQGSIETDRAEAELEMLKDNWVPREELWEEFQKFDYWRLLTVEGWSAVVSGAIESMQSLFADQPVFYSAVTYHAIEESLAGRQSVESYTRLVALQKHVNGAIAKRFEERGWKKKEMPISSVPKTDYAPVRISSVSNAIFLDLRDGNFPAVEARIEENAELFQKCVPESGVLQEKVMWDLLLDQKVKAETLLKLHRFLSEKKLATRFTLIAAVAKSIGLETFHVDMPFDELDEVVAGWVYPEGFFKPDPRTKVPKDLYSPEGVSEYVHESLSNLSVYAYLGGVTKKGERVGWYARVVEDALSDSVAVYSSPEVFSYFERLKAEVHVKLQEALRADGWVDGDKA